MGRVGLGEPGAAADPRSRDRGDGGRHRQRRAARAGGGPRRRRVAHRGLDLRPVPRRPAPLCAATCGSSACTPTAGSPSMSSSRRRMPSSRTASTRRSSRSRSRWATPCTPPSWSRSRGRSVAGHRLRSDRPVRGRHRPGRWARRVSSPPTPSRSVSSSRPAWAPIDARRERSGHGRARSSSATDGDGVDVVLEMSGAGPALDQGLAAVTRGGSVACSGPSAGPCRSTCPTWSS